MLANLVDRWESCKRRNIPTSTRFLTEAEQQLASNVMKQAGGDVLLWGGYEGAERRLACFLPDYLTADDVNFSLFSLKLLRCRVDSFSDALPTHRDYLGALMALGIERNTIGDILICADSADIVATDAAAKVILDGLQSVGRWHLSCTEIDPSRIHIPQTVYEDLTVTVASLRLDGVTAACFRLSREESARAVRCGRVQVNGVEITKPDAELRAGDKIALRGGGKVLLSEIGGQSKKGRIRLLCKRPK